MRHYQGKLIVHTGSMFSGKTSGLLEDLRRFEIAGLKVILYKPEIDNRFSESSVKTHSKNYERTSFNIKNIQDIMTNDILNHDVIGIDEVQFISSQFISSYGAPNDVASFLSSIVSNFKKTVVVAGLDLDYKGAPFEVVKELLPLADYVYKHHAVCINCGNDAWISHRISEDDERIKIGDLDKYVPLCRHCYNEIQRIKIFGKGSVLNESN